MTLRFKVGTMPARKFHVSRRRVPPEVGDVFEIVDKTIHGCRPQRVRLTEIKTHTGGGDIYFVDLW